MQSNIKIAGFQKNTFIDYPGKIAAIIFLGGCNFVCYYCHNNDILCNSSNKVDFAEVLEELREQVGFLDGVVISGGEPTLYPHIQSIISKIRELGFKIKLDTNGSNFEILKGLDVDCIAMDVKAPLHRYKEITGYEDIDEIKKSIEYVKARGYFRLTLPSDFVDVDIEEIGKLVEGCELFHLQKMTDAVYFNVERFADILRKYCKKVELRGF